MLTILTAILIKLGTSLIKKHLVSLEEQNIRKKPMQNHIKIMANSVSHTPVVIKFFFYENNPKSNGEQS